MMSEWGALDALDLIFRVLVTLWIVVISVDGRYVSIQNPETARVERYKRKRFEKYMGFDGQMRMVSIYP